HGLEVECFLRIAKSHRFLVVELGVFHVQENVAEAAVEVPLPPISKWTVHGDGASDCGMSGKLSPKIGAPEWIEIETIHAECERSWISGAHLDVAVCL